MKGLNIRIADMSHHLQSLTAPELYPQVQDAVEREDKKRLVELCKKAKIPAVYIGTVMSVLLSVGPQQKWPAEL